MPGAVSLALVIHLGITGRAGAGVLACPWLLGAPLAGLPLAPPPDGVSQELFASDNTTAWCEGDGRPMRLVRALGGEVRGPLLSFTDQVVVVANEGFPYAVAYDEMEAGCAYRTRVDTLALRRGGQEHLQATDHYALGLFALDRDRFRIASRHFREAAAIDERFRQLGEESLAEFRRLRQDPFSKVLTAHGRLDRDLEGPGEERVDLPVMVGGGPGLETSPGDDTDRNRIIAGYKEVGRRVCEMLKADLALVETPHFMIWTDWPRGEQPPLARWSEQMYAALASRFGLDPAGNVFAGKCPLFCLSSKAGFNKVGRLLDGQVPEQALGYTSKAGNGHVHIVLYRHDRSQAALDRFGVTLVHEGTHAFLHAHGAPEGGGRLPAWIEEGLADFIAEDTLQDRCPTGEAAAAVAREVAHSGVGIGPVLADDGPLEARYYAVAHSLVAFLLRKDAVAFGHLIDDIKRGTAPADALRRRYDWDREALERAWRRAHDGGDR